ncbi:MAG: TetR/AcrR family transcriptional regulator [Acidimicrobiia bacterium]|nr:TetR/AcrR family transcriptional regulator [Acidimicrobiia bacterium]
MTDTAPTDADAVPATVADRPGPDETRDRLRRAAAEVFAEKGYEGAGVQEIARRAGLTTGAIYSRYSGKAELLAEAIRAESGPQFDELFATASPEGQAAELIRRAGSHLVTRDPAAGGILLEAFVAARRDPELRALLRKHVATRTEIFGRIIGLAKSHGDIDESLDTESIVHLCQAVAFGFLLYEAIDAPRPEPGAWSALIDRLVDAAGIPNPTEPDPEGDPR